MDAFRLADLERRMARIETWREGLMNTIGHAVERLGRIERSIGDQDGIKALRKDVQDIENLLEFCRTKFERQFPPDKAFPASQK